MSLLPRITGGLRALLQKEKVEQELDEELRGYLQAAVDDKMRAGMSREEALCQARVEIDNPESVKEQVRAEGWERVVETLWQDLRHGARLLARTPAFTAVAMLTLALGIGANTAIFSVIHTVLLKPLPYPDADRLVMIWEKVRLPFYQNDQNNPAPGNFADWRSRNTVFENMAAIRYRSFSLTGDGEPLRVEGEGVSASVFSVLQVKPILGRVFTVEEDQAGGPRVVLIGYGLWASRFASDRQVLGRTIYLDGENYTVIGVMGPGSHFPDPDDQLWVPVALTPDELANHGSHYLRVVGRLKAGITLAQARQQMDAIAHRLTEQYPTSNAGQTVNLVPLRDQIVGAVRPALLVLLGAVGVVLLIVCANVAGLLLARSSARQREMAIRFALGATRGRVVRQLLTESMLLALLGGALGTAIAYWGVAMFRSLSPVDLPRADEIAVNVPVLLFSLGITILAGFLFGAVPALQATRNTAQVREGSRESAGRAPLRARNMLVVAETALGVVVIVSAALLFRSFLVLQQVPLGFRTENVLSMRVIARGDKYAEPSRRIAFYRQSLEQISALPGTESAAAVTFLPLTKARASKGFSIEGRVPPAPGQLPMAEYNVVTPAYFRSMQVPLLAGRDFSWNDTSTTLPVIIINQAMARTYWPNENPLGQHIKQGLPDAPAPWLTVVGVVGDVRQFDVVTAPRPAMYFPVTQFEDKQGIVRDWVVRTSGNPDALARAVRETIWSIDRDMPISRIQTLAQVRAAAVGPQQLNFSLFGMFAAVALVLAAVGLYRVTAYSVAQRTREIGIRMALGATPGNVLRLVLSMGGALAVKGVVIGIVASLALTRLMASLLYGISATDPLTFSAVTVLLLLVALMACYLPARHAMRVDPVVALRYE